jgi:hypothetical protein
VLGIDPVQIRSATHGSGYATAVLAVRSRGARTTGVDLLGRGSDRDREFEQWLRMSGADEVTAARALWISVGGCIPVAAPGFSPRCSAYHAGKPQISAALVVHNQRHGKTTRGILHEAVHGKRVGTRRGIRNDVGGRIVVMAPGNCGANRDDESERKSRDHAR